jgi:predicted DNA-binding transcriptional regulator AlpA
MLARTLQRLVDTNLTSIQEIAELTGVSNSTVYRWVAGKCQPDFESIRRLIRTLPNPRAQEALLSVITSGSAWGIRPADTGLDVNNDGTVDFDDALDASIQAVHAAGQSLTSVREATGDGQMHMYQLVTVIGQLNEVIHNATMVQDILIRTIETQEKKKKSKR